MTTEDFYNAISSIDTYIRMLDNIKVKLNEIKLELANHIVQDTVPCPRCKKQPVIRLLYDGKYTISCAHTGCRFAAAHAFNKQSITGDSVYEVVSKWNRYVRNENRRTNHES